MTQSTTSTIVEQIKGWDTEELDEAMFTLRQELQERPDTNYLYTAWHTDDILQCRPDLTQEQCQEVLTSLGDNHDANYGINWNIIQMAAEILYPAPSEENDDG